MVAMPGSKFSYGQQLYLGVKACLCCSVAFALQRRAEAYMAVQHYSAAAADLQKLVEQSGSSSSEVAARLASAQAKQKLHGSVGPNHYLILGLEAGASSAEVKAAFKWV